MIGEEQEAEMAMTKTPQRKNRVNRTATPTKARSKKPTRRGPSLAAANKWLSEQHDSILKLAEKNTARLTGKPRL
jgi:hypothetical protein